MRVIVAYGFFFGVYPSIVAEAFGVNGISQNWGWMNLSPVLFGQFFNIIYGRVYDHHSIITPGGLRDCVDGRECYSNAYWVTFGASVLSVLISLWAIRHHNVAKAAELKKEHDEARQS
jgi:hypothetical protein